MSDGRTKDPLYLPTPEEIRKETAAIRAGWSQHEWSTRVSGYSEEIEQDKESRGMKREHK